MGCPDLKERGSGQTPFWGEDLERKALRMPLRSSYSSYVPEGAMSPPMSRSTNVSSYYSTRDYSSYGTGTSASAYSAYRPSSPGSSFTSRSTGRTFRSRFLRSHHRDPSTDDDQSKSRTANGDATTADSSGNPEGATDSQGNKQVNLSKKAKRKLLRNATILNNGSVIRIRREKSSDEESSEEDDDTSEEEENTAPEADQQHQPEPEPEPVKEPTPEPEDPLDVEERELNTQLLMSLTLTLVDEENIRQRLLEIRKTRLRRTMAGPETESLASKFQSSAECALFENEPNVVAKEDEEKALIQRLEEQVEEGQSPMSEVEQRDACVRLQEIFQDRKSALNHIVEIIEQSYEQILQDTTTELTELESSISGKKGQIERLQEEILSMTVKRETLSKQMEVVTESHSARQDALNKTADDINQKMSKYAVIKQTASGQAGSKKDQAKSASKNNKKNVKSQELAEVEAELECPVCMDVSRPPIYQCEEGHIVCPNCKPMLKECPICSQRYSEPAIRCRFAEKLADKYFAAIQQFK